MGGFEHLVVRKPSDIENLLKALSDLRLYLQATNQLEHDPDGYGLLCCGTYKDEKEIVCKNYPHDTTDCKNTKPISVETVTDYFPDHLEDLKKGKWILYWLEITWLRKIPLPIINRLRQALKEHNCEWFWDEL